MPGLTFCALMVRLVLRCFMGAKHMKRLALSALVLSVLSMNVACSSEAAVEEEEVDQGALEDAPNPNAVLNVPFYFSVPQASLTRMTSAERNHPWPTAWNPARGTNGELGLRIIAIKDSGAGARKEMGEKLAQSGVIK